MKESFLVSIPYYEIGHRENTFYRNVEIACKPTDYEDICQKAIDWLKSKNYKKYSNVEFGKPYFCDLYVKKNGVYIGCWFGIDYQKPEEKALHDYESSWA